ncbi:MULTISPECIES: hypothetical protein [Sphingobacterium]|uniref:hypothetical protein n=1 Tax=Sphingobacterium TaxID=28453 RepID=UPI00257C5239|nr:MULTISPECIES: hypothetical protein [Sphingobacterium]
MADSNKFVKASRQELDFIRKHAPRGLWKMIQLKTNKSRSQVDYQLRLSPEHQDRTIIETTRELFQAVTGLTFKDSDK